jgi:hypothetical protein
VDLTVLELTLKASLGAAQRRGPASQLNHIQTQSEADGGANAGDANWIELPAGMG